MVYEQDLVDLLKMLEKIGIGIWIDGGWGIDALLGYQTRPHNDIDIFIEKKDKNAFIEMLNREGYYEIQMEYTTEDHTVWRDSCDRIIDLHLFEFGDAEVLYFDNETYPKGILDGKGIIGGVEVRCLTAEAQLLYHQGYEYQEKDIQDVLLLCKTFGLTIPAAYRVYSVLDKATQALKSVSGIKAVVLGGSRARGTHTADSDIDIGIYYDSKQLDIARLETIASELDDEHRNKLIAAPGEWGNWVNGGGWLVIDGCHVDLLLRDIDRVEKVIAECQEGIVTPHYQTGHPHAYISAMYMGELAVSKMLWDSSGDVSRLKAITETYPPKLKAAIIGFFTFEAGFSCMFAESNASKDDGYYVFAHLVRAVSCLNQVLFALNEQYCLNEKKAVKMTDGFAVKPVDYKIKVDDIFNTVAQNQLSACSMLAELIEEVKAL